MRKTLIVLALAGLFTGGVAAPALAGPKIPSNCQEWNDLLGIDNVRECEDPDWS